MCVGLGTSGGRSAARFALSQKMLLGLKENTMYPLACLLSMEAVGNENVLERNRGPCGETRGPLGL